MTIVLVLDERDDVGVCIDGVDAGVTIAVPGRPPLATRHAIPPGHKVAVRPVAPGAPVHKYGEVIGVATTAIQPGDHVHTHNLDTVRADGVTA